MDVFGLAVILAFFAAIVLAMSFTTYSIVTGAAFLGGAFEMAAAYSIRGGGAYNRPIPFTEWGGHHVRFGRANAYSPLSCESILPDLAAYVQRGAPSLHLLLLVLSEGHVSAFVVLLTWP
jgi:hypothetical protein